MPPTPWDELLVRLAATPRENGTAALHRTAAWLHDVLGQTGWAVERVAFTAHPYGLRLAGVLALAATLAYLRAVRAGRGGLALALVLAAPAAAVADLEHGVPVFSWIGAERAHHVVARAAPTGPPVQRLVLAAHYDTKTDLLDHAQRGVVESLGPPVLGAMALAAVALALAPGARAARRAAGLAGWLGVAWGAALFAALSAGAFAPRRSPGALDDGGSCAVLVRLAGRLADAEPLRRTELELWLLAAEEVGVQGSRVYAARRFAGGADLPTFVVNLERLGASMRLGVARREEFLLRGHRADPRVRALLASVYREREGRELAVAGGGATDARSFLAAGIPAATLFSREPGVAPMRGLHSARDDRSRLDRRALEGSVGFLAAVVRAADARPLPLR